MNLLLFLLSLSFAAATIHNTTAIVVIDIQNDYFPGGALPLVGPIPAANNAAAVLTAARKAQCLVVYMQHQNIDPHAPPPFKPGTWGDQINEIVAPQPTDHVLVKHYPNSYRGTGLIELFKQHSISQVVYVGMMSHMCVDSSVRAGFDLEYPGALAYDACATMNLPWGGETLPAETVHESFMSALGLGFAETMTTTQVIAKYLS